MGREIARWKSAARINATIAAPAMTSAAMPKYCERRAASSLRSERIQSVPARVLLKKTGRTTEIPPRSIVEPSCGAAAGAVGPFGVVYDAKRCPSLSNRNAPVTCGCARTAESTERAVSRSLNTRGETEFSPTTPVSAVRSASIFFLKVSRSYSASAAIVINSAARLVSMNPVINLLRMERSRKRAIQLFPILESSCLFYVTLLSSPKAGRTTTMTSHDDTQTSRGRLLTAGKGLFSRLGYEGTSTATIAREAGTSESQLVRYFV